MAKPSDISIQIVADNSKAEKAIRKLIAEIKKFQQQIEAVNKSEKEHLARKLQYDKKELESAKARNRQLIQDRKRQIEQIEKAVILDNAKHGKLKRDAQQKLNAHLRKGEFDNEAAKFKTITAFNNKVIAEAKKTEEQRLRTKLQNSKRIINVEREIARIEARIQKEAQKKGLQNYQLTESFKLQLARSISNKNQAIEKQRAAKVERLRREELQKQKQIDRERKANFVALLRDEIRQTKGTLDLEVRLEEAKAQKIKFKESEITNFKLAQQNQVLQAKKRNDALTKSSEASALRDLKKLHKDFINYKITETKGLFNFEERIRQAEKQGVKFTQSEVQAFKIRTAKAVARETDRLRRKNLADQKRSNREDLNDLAATTRKRIAAGERYTRKQLKDLNLTRAQIRSLHTFQEKQSSKSTNKQITHLDRLKQKSREAYGTMGQAAQNFASSINQHLVFALQAATLSMAALSVQVIRVGAEFEQAVATLGAIRGQAGEALRPFEEQARLLGETTAFTATEAARGMQELARAGLQTGDIISSSNAALKFAGANATDMTTSTTLLAATMAQFGLSATQSSRVVDTFTTALQNSLLNVETLQVAMRYAGAVGASFGRSLEETTAMVALFRDLGLEGSTAGTQFRQAFLRLASPTKKAKEVLKDYGIALEDINPRVRTFQQILQTLADSGIAQDVPAIKELVSIRAAGSFSKILSDVADGSSKLSSLLLAFEQGAGVTEKTYSDMINTVSGQTAILKSVIEETFLRFFDIVTMKGFDDKSNPIISLLTVMQNIFKDINTGLSEFTSQFQSEIETLAKEVTGTLEDNSAQIAATFVSAIISLKDFVSFLISIRHELKLILKALVVFSTITTLAKTAAGAVKALAVAITAAKGTLALLRGQATLTVAAIAGPVGLIAVLGAAAAAFYKLSAAEESYERNKARLQNLIVANKEATEEYNEVLKQTIVNQTEQGFAQTAILEKLIRLGTDDSVIASLKQELDVVEDLTEEQKLQALQQGKLTLVRLGYNRKLLMSQVAIERFKKIAFKDNKNLINEEIALNNAQSDSIKSLRKEIRRLETAFVHTNEVINKSKNPSDELIQLRERQETQLKLTKARLDGLIQSIQEAANSEEREAAITRATLEMKEAMNENQQIGNEQTQDQIDLLELLNAAMQARLDLEKEIADAQLEQFGTNEEKAAKAEEDRIEAIEKVFDEEIKLREQHGKDTTFLQKRLYDALAQDRENRNKAEIDDLKEQLDETVSTRLNAVKQIERAFEKESKVIKEGKAEFLKQENIAHDNIVQEQVEFLERKAADLVSSLVEGEITEEEFRQKSIEIQNAHQLEIERLRAESDARVLEQSEVTKDLLLAKELEKNAKIKKAQEAYAKGFNQVTIENIQSVSDFSKAILQLQSDAQELETNFLSGEDLGQFHKLAAENIDLQAQALKQLRNSLFETKEATQDYTDSLLNLTDLTAFSSAMQGTIADLQIRAEESGFKASAAKAKLLEIRMMQLGLVAKETDELISNLADTVSDKLPSGFKQLFDLFRTGINAVRDVRRSFIDLNDILDTIQKIQTDGFLSVFKVSLRDFNLKDFIQSLLKLKDAFKNIGKAALNASIEISKISLEKLKQGLDFLTGGVNFNPFEIINDSLSEFSKLSEDAEKKQKDLQDALASGSITQAEFDEANAVLEQQKQQGASPEQIQAFANNFVTEISDRIKMIAQVAGPVLQAIAAEIPNLVQTFITEIPKIVTSLAAALPDFFFAILDGLTAVFTTLTQQIKNTSSEAASSFFSELSTKFVNLIGSFAGFITAAIQQIVANLPQIIGGLTEIINGLITALGSIMTTLISSLPDIATALLDGLVSIIDNLGPILRNIITAIADMLPDLLIAIADAIPKLLGSLGRMLGDVLIGLASAIPKVITAFLNAFPRIVAGLIEGAIEFVMAIVEAVPDIIIALVKELPKLIIALVTKFPRMVIELVALIIRKLPEIAFRLVMALLIELPKALVIAAVEFGKAFVNAIKQFFKDAIQRIKDALNPFKKNDDNDNNKGNNKNNKKDEPSLVDTINALLGLGAASAQVEFADTPHPIKAGTEGLTARFAKGDFIIAAQEPVELMRQSLMAMGGNLSSFADNLSSSIPTPNITPPIMQGGGSSQVDIAVMADGRLLDAIQVRAMNNGNAPEMEKKFRRSSGATVGFNRGRFNKFGKR